MVIEHSTTLIGDYLNHFTSLFSTFELENAYGLVGVVLNVTAADCVRYFDVTRYKLNFDDQQLKLLTFLSSLFAFNLFVIGLMWKFNGSRVFKKFKKPATRKVIEELKRSVDQLKLPKVHSPRI
ncbi:alveolar soft part sarcoma chromosome region, candidate 1 [Nesidiocoris tenuis]|uniref:Alveolar soft part sarcoma chromosome region, candidate 1 n=1 Tax=Nesidiocoris tenuis TaxID=355587 RepID=A0ABN7BAZ8_9HEMI|nr:alveolar soft part sarcoma chromosome region, candidate 1 [Nesidiocoris tenuis]